MEYTVRKARPIRWWDWLSGLLLIAAMYIAATRLDATNWTNELSLVQTVAIYGVIAGLALGKSTFSIGWARFFAFAYGSFVIFWQLGMTLGRGVLWPERMISMGNRLVITLDQIFQQKPVIDNLFFNLLMASLFWILSVYAGYSLTRHGNPWRAIIPTGFALIIIHGYDSFIPIRSWFLAGFIFFALLLVARMHFVKLQQRWKQNGTYLPPFVGIDSLRLGLITTVILVLFAWTVPAIASTIPQAEQVWLNATRPWLDVRNSLSNIFYSLQSSFGVVADFYGDSLPLGRGNPLSDTVIMTVEAPPRITANVRYYWRSRIYDKYEDGWTSTLPEVEFVTPDDFDLNIPEDENRTRSTFTITTVFPIQNLHTPTQPVWVSRPADAYFAINPDGSVDLSHLKADPVLLGGDTYKAEALVTATSVNELREAGIDYPTWVTDRYLQLSETITPRTLQLAEEIASGHDNPYDITQAVTDYLRSNLEYNGTVPAPPAGTEPIDWVLFEHKQAFCNYYASAEIVMLRALGIPARLAVGYAEGESNPIIISEEDPSLGAGGRLRPDNSQAQGELFNVSHRDAHAWPEVYFPNIGWVEFEPTISQQPIIRPISLLPNSTGSSDQATQNEDPRPERSQGDFSAAGESAQNTLDGMNSFDPTPIWITLITVIIISTILFVRRLRIRRGSPPIPVQIESSLARAGIKSPKLLQRWARYATISPLSRAYLELNNALARLGQPPNEADTPSERGKDLVQLLPLAEAPVQTVLTPYQNSIYGNQTSSHDEAQIAGKEIRKLSYLARLQHFLARFQDPNHKNRSAY
ncbi:transglutaminase family protein [Chloroflexota bacterium]